MSVRSESCHDLDVFKHERHEKLSCSTSNPLACSYEPKPGGHLEEGSNGEFTDYSLINTRYKQSCPSYTAHAHSTSNLTTVNDNRISYNSRVDPSSSTVSFRSGNIQSRTAAGKTSNSPYVEEQVYSFTNYSCGSNKQNSHSEPAGHDDTRLRCGSELSRSAYRKHSIQVWKHNIPASGQYHRAQKTANPHQDLHTHRHLNTNNELVLNTFQTQHPLSSPHSIGHYQQPKVRSPSGGDLPHQRKSQTQAQTDVEPPYPAPPRYNHQHHARRKTWSPSALKMTLVSASPQESRVRYNSDSLDIDEEALLEATGQIPPDDLDVSPPKLAPISGVLAQKPGSNVIRPIAFKPVQSNSSGSSAGHVTRRQRETADDTNGYEGIRSQVLTQNPHISGAHAPLYLQDGVSKNGAFNSTIQVVHHTTSGSVPLPPTSLRAQEAGSHYHATTSHSQSTNFNSFYNNLQASSPIISQSSVINNTYSNVLVTSSNSTNPSCLSTRRCAGVDRCHTSQDVRPVYPSSAPCLSSEGLLLTPSPSDSGVGELEAMLREKDAEIHTLREVMDRNERAIFQVYEERRNTWLHNTQELHNDYERQLKVQSQKAAMTEQALSQQISQLQKKLKTLQEDHEKMESEYSMTKQQSEENQSLVSQLKLSLETVSDVSCISSKDVTGVKLTEAFIDPDVGSDKDNQSLQEELALKNKELIVLKSKLHSLQEDVDKKNKELAEKAREVVAKTEELKMLKHDLIRLKDPPALVNTSVQTHVPSEVATSENVKPSLLGEKERIVLRLQEELTDIKAQMAVLKEEHEKERVQWLDEKNKVVRYQKQLQLNYVQMQRKNVTLETEVQQLTLELESRDMKLIALTGEDSVC